MSRISKRVLITLIAIAVIIAVSMAALTACTPESKKQQAGGTTPDDLNVYAFTAVSGASLLADSFSNDHTAGVSATADTVDPLTRPDGIADEDIARIKEYLGMFEGYLLNNGISSEATVPTEEDGEYASYQVKVAIDLPNAQGGTDTFIMYYNELDANAGKTDDGETQPAAAADKDAEDENAEDENNGNEVEVESGIEGIMLLEGNAYPIIGEVETETENGETERELSIKVYLSETERNTFIGIKQEIENDEIEYVYSVHSNGNLISKTSVEFEYDIEENEQEIKLSFIDKASGTPSNTWYKIEKNDGETTTFSVKYNLNDGQTQKFDIEVNEGIYTFVYRNGFTETV